MNRIFGGLVATGAEEELPHDAIISSNPNIASRIANCGPNPGGAPEEVTDPLIKHSPITESRRHQMTARSGRVFQLGVGSAERAAALRRLPPPRQRLGPPS